MSRDENFLAKSSIIFMKVAEEILIVNALYIIENILLPLAYIRIYVSIYCIYYKKRMHPPLFLQEYSQEAVSHVHKYLMKNEVPVNLFEVGSFSRLFSP